jgi:ribosomal protein S18 acetylase RimI-like enzyme
MADVRPAEARDDAAVARLLYESASGRYDFFAGGRERALRLLGATIASPGNDTSREEVLVAEVDGEVAGAMASFPGDEGPRRRDRFLRMTLRRRAPWRWMGILRMARAGARSSPAPPPGSLYIDGLATAARFRRRGVATALLHAADARARSLGLTSVALDTAEHNLGAQALYEGTGFRESRRVRARGGIPAIVFYERDVA